MKAGKLGTSGGIALLALLVTQPALPALTEPSEGLIKDDDLGVDWAKDGNLFATQVAADATIVDAIIALTPTIPNPEDSTDHALSSADFIVDSNSADFGKMSWFGAVAWVAWLNDIQYLGKTDWRLPKVRPQIGIQFNPARPECGGKSDAGYYLSGIESEWPHLFYDELGNTAIYKKKRNGPCPSEPQAEFGLVNAGAFINLKQGTYWTGTDFPAIEVYQPGAFFFDTNTGVQNVTRRTEPGFPDLFAVNYAIPVSGKGFVSGDYDVTASTCTGLIDRKGRTVKLTVSVVNSGVLPNRRAVLEATATQGEVPLSAKPKKKAFKFKPGLSRELKVSWRTKAAGPVVFTAKISDFDTDPQDDTAEDVIETCTISE